MRRTHPSSPAGARGAVIEAHDHVRRYFANALASGRLHHAWLLHGVKGIGKRMLADELAAMLICERQSACGDCHACRMFAAGAHPDVYQAGLLEGKRDITIEQIRELLDFLALSGLEGDRRLVILDDAERMNAQAANALLKGLEEPPPGSVLLMVCADIERLPATIRSRCLLQHCSPLNQDAMRKALVGMGIDAVYLDLALRLADGAPGRVQCMRDANIAAALLEWWRLTEDLTQADIGEMERWIRENIARVPHELIVRIVALHLFPRLVAGGEDFKRFDGLHRALLACLRWPGDVMRHSLRPAPSLLANLLGLRAALRDISR